MNREELQKKIDESQMVLLGLGEDFNDRKRLADDSVYKYGKGLFEQAETFWLLPVWAEYCSERMDNRVGQALNILAEMLKNKNYFMVSTANDSRVSDIKWKNGWFVMPCGSVGRKQCSCKCLSVNVTDTKEPAAETIEELQQMHNAANASNKDSAGNAENLNKSNIELLTAGDGDRLNSFFGALYRREISTVEQIKGLLETPLLGTCPHCGAPMVFNTIYADAYDENGYAKQWELHKKWLTGTINKKLLLLELGAGFDFPSVIRWPFEKVAMYNQKSELIRVHENLYQLPDNLEGRGMGVAENAVEWILNLC